LNRHPDGGSIGDGGSPVSTRRLANRPRDARSDDGTADSSACVYGFVGAS
jgi:hypothetical protein